MTFEAGPVAQYLMEDHERIADLFERGATDASAYARFRARLLRHIGMEEKVLLPAAKRANGGEALPAAERLRLDHGALVALMVPPPDPQIRAAVAGVIAKHNVIEEGPDGVHHACETLVGEEAGALLEALRAFPDVPVLPHFDSPIAMDAAKRALARAGYALEEFDPVAGMTDVIASTSDV